LTLLNHEENLKSIREEYQNSQQATKVSMKSSSGGMLNSIGSYNFSSSTNQSTFGLGQVGVNNLSSKNLEREKKSPIDDSDSESEEDGINTKEILRKNTNTSYNNNLMNFDEILSSSNKIESNEDQSSKKVDLLSMNDLFSPSTNSNSNNLIEQGNFVFDFTKK
jgi:hypothetical protein